MKDYAIMILDYLSWRGNVSSTFKTTNQELALEAGIGAKLGITGVKLPEDAASEGHAPPTDVLNDRRFKRVARETDLLRNSP